LSDRIGFFGGTFDPIHNGHLRLADNALTECGLDQIVFIPAAIPPHKSPVNLTQFSHRVEMLNAALQGRQAFVCSTVEAELPAPTYTVDTLRYLRQRYAPDAGFFFLTGLDAFLEITTWKEYLELLCIASFIVSEREGGQYAQEKEMLADRIGYYRQGTHWIGKNGRLPIFFLTGPPLALSSSMVRRRVRQNLSIRGMVPEGVRRYIEKYRIYCMKNDI
jgi:nicotinate-nucleotide adenylyltransferase